MQAINDQWFPADIDTSDVTDSYYGYQEKNGGWYILKDVGKAGVYRYVIGDSAYATAWTNRATALGYDYPAITFRVR